MNIGNRVFCIPTYQPVSPYRQSMAGAPHTHMRKYVHASLLTSPVAPESSRATLPNGI